MRRLLAVLLTSALLAGACSNGEDTARDVGDHHCPVDELDAVHGPPDEPVEGDRPEPVEVVVWNTLTAEPLRTARAMVDDYNASQDRVRIRLENQGIGYQEIQRQYNTAMRDGTLPPMVILEDTQTRFLADSGSVIPAEVCAEAAGVDLDRYLPVVREYYSVDGTLLPASVNLSTAVLYYNRDHFREAGLDPDDPPGTLEEVTETARALQEAGVTERPFVQVMQPWFVEHWLTGAGVPIVDNDNGRAAPAETSTFDDETTVELYRWLADLHDEGLLNPIPGTEGQANHYFEMGAQTASFTIETSTAVSTINAVLEGTADPAELGLDLDELPPIDIDVGVAPMPGIEGPGRVQAGGGVWYLTTGADDLEIAAAWDFIEWFNEADQQVRWTEGSSYLPWNTEAIDSPELAELWGQPRPGGWSRTAYEQFEAMDPDSTGPLIGPYTQVREAIRRSLDDLIFDGVPPQDAVASANDRIDAALEEYRDFIS